jgi:hypothetical protein
MNAPQRKAVAQFSPRSAWRSFGVVRGVVAMDATLIERSADHSWNTEEREEIEEIRSDGERKYDSCGSIPVKIRSGEACGVQLTAASASMVRELAFQFS